MIKLNNINFKIDKKDNCVLEITKQMPSMYYLLSYDILHKSTTEKASAILTIKLHYDSSMYPEKVNSYIILVLM